MRTRRIVAVVGALGLVWTGLVAAGAVAPAAASVPSPGWPQFRSSPDHSGANPADSLITPANVSTLAPAWGPTAGGGVSSPAVVGGVIYSGSRDHGLNAFNATSGQLLWSAPVGGGVPSSPAVADGVVYAGSSDHKLYAFDAATGQLLWSATTGAEIDASPVVSGGVVFIGSYDTKLYAFDAAGSGCSGTPKVCTPLWTADTPRSITSTAAVVDGVVYVGSEQLYAFDAAGVVGCSGTPKACTPLWTGATGVIDSSPTVAGGIVYVGSYDSNLYAFDAAGLFGCTGSPRTCAPLWTGATGAGVFSSPAVAAGVVYVGSYDKRLHAFDATGVTSCSGEPKACLPLWTSETLSDIVISSPAAVGGLVFIGEGIGKTPSRGILAFDATGTAGCSGAPKVCSPVWTGPMPSGVRSSPAVAGRMVYAGSDDGSLTAFAIPATLDISAGRFQPVGPARTVDTRTVTGGHAAPIGPGTTRTVPIAGRGGVPATGAAAVVVNVTVTQPTAAGYLTIHPTGVARPSASNLNFTANQTVANLAVVPIGMAGSIDVFNAFGSTHLLVDVVGWLGDGGTPAGSRYNPSAPARIRDTRNGTGGPSSRMGPAATTNVVVRGRGGLPVAGMTSVLLNITATGPTTSGYLTVSPSGTARPPTSNLNFAAGQTVANLTLVPVGPDGSIDVFNATGTTHLIIDVVGWFGAEGAPAGARHHGMAPSRIFDTRTGTGTAALPMGPGGIRGVLAAGQGGVPPTGVSAVVVNVTATQPSSGGYLTLFPSGTAPPVVSNLNFAPGRTVANLAVVPLGAAGSISVFNATGATHVIVDVVGWLGADGA